ncbi:response regulator [Hyphobacterium sp.]|uniref:response regulator n=1 Tax=Hyphobacterium sp. TaxID=2004662 RepID=UPI003BAA6671
MFGLEFKKRAQKKQQELARKARDVNEGALEEIDRARLEIYYKNCVSAVPFNVLNALILGAMLLTAVPPLQVGIWFATGVFFATARYFLARHALKSGAHLPPLTQKLFTLLTVGSGSIWGLAIFLLPPDQMTFAHFAVGFMVAGMTAGAAISSATKPIAIVAYNAPALAPVIAFLVMLGGVEGYGLAAVLALYFAVTIRISAQYRDTLKTAFEANASLEGARTRVETQAKALRELARRHEHTAKRGEQAISEKTAFLSSVSHDIKNPLAGIMGVARRISEDDTLDDDTRKKTRQIYEAGETLMRFVGDLRDVAVIEAGNLSLAPGEITVERLARDTRMLWEPKAKAKGLGFNIRVTGDDRLVLAADSARVKQMLFTYIRNALRYTASGQVDVAIDIENLGSRAQIKVAVDDTGKGVPREAEGRLFKSFFESDEDGIRVMDGTSTGLTITRYLAEAMNGKVGYARRRDGGSHFWFTIELPSLERREHSEESTASAATSPTAIEDARPAKAARRSGPELPERPLRVLAAEDNAINRTVIEGFLIAKGWSVEFAENGQHAVDAARNRAFDLILMDMRMPVMDGLQATKAIRDLPTTAAMTPIIALTANARREDEAACLAAGMDGFISKPIDTQRLFDTIAGVLSDGGSVAVAQAS